MIPAAPRELSAESQARWPGLAADLAAVTDGAAIDYDLLASVLHACDRLASIRVAIDADGVAVSGSKGQVRPHPLLSIEVNLRREIAQGFDRLGLSPSRRRNGYVRVDRTGRLRKE